MLLSLFPHLCFKVAPCSSCSESHILCFKVAPCFSYSESHKFLFHTSGNFSLQNLACIFLRWASSNALGLHEQASQMHTHQFLLLSFHTLIALVHPLHGKPYSLTLISIDGHLHSPLIRLVDVRLSPLFLSSPQPPQFHPQCYVHGSRSCNA